MLIRALSSAYVPKRFERSHCEVGLTTWRSTKPASLQRKAVVAAISTFEDKVV